MNCYKASPRNHAFHHKGDEIAVSYDKIVEHRKASEFGKQ
jgi:hypothetical protein